MKIFASSRLRASWSLVLLFTLAGCASNVKVPDLDQTLQQGYIPLEEEIWASEQADQFHEEFVKKGLLYSSPTMLEYLNSVRLGLLAGTPYKDHINVYLIRSASPNAFALPNGNVYLHTGLFSALENEAQLAAILSHEFMHVINRHGVKSVIDRKNTLVGAHVADLFTGGLGLVYVGAMANIMDYSREQERDADTGGLRLLIQANYPAQAMADAFESFQRHPELKHVKQSIYSSHPSYSDRIKSLEALAAESGKTINPAGPVDQSAFAVTRKKLINENIKIHLRHRQFNLAKTVVDDVADEILEPGKVAFFRGEVHMGFYKFPEIAAREQYWIETGKEKTDSDTLQSYLTDKNSNLNLAIAAYQLSIAQPGAPYAPAYKSLGEALALKGDKAQAINAYRQYLELAPQARDRRYVEYKMKKIY